MSQPVNIFTLVEFPEYYFTKIGEGAYGEVFRGWNTSGRNIVVKRIKDEQPLLGI